MIKLVVFDMAGTTIYDGDAVNMCLQQALHARGVDVHRDAVNSVMGYPKPDAIRSLLIANEHISDIDLESEVDLVFKDFQHRMLMYYRYDVSVRPVEGAEQVFRQLRAAGVRVALDTGFNRRIADTILHRLGWTVESGILDATITSDEVERGRPFADMIIRLMEITDVSNCDEVAKVGDTPSDLQEGTAAGCSMIIGVTDGSHTRAELEPHPHTHLVATVADVPGIVLSSAVSRT
jgi:phosphonatase-like hydrolase